MSDDLGPPSTCASISLMRWCCRALAMLLLVGTVLLPSAAFGDNGSWVGQRIMTKRAGTMIGYADWFGRPVYIAELTDMVYTVLQEQDGWLHVRQRGVEGWL